MFSSPTAVAYSPKAPCPPAHHGAPHPAPTCTESQSDPRFVQCDTSLKACAGERDPVSAAGKSAALAFSAFPDAPAAEAEILAHWVFDMVIAIRLRWPRPLPLIGVKILDPKFSGRTGEGGERGPATPTGQKPPLRRLPWPPLPPSTMPLILPAAPKPSSPSRRNSAPNRPKKSSTSCSLKIASRRPRPPATRP